VAVALLSACSKITAGGTGGGTAAPARTASVEATKALETSARQVRSLVGTLAAPMRRGALKKEVTVDDAGPCQVGVDKPWPKRWGYALMVTLNTATPIAPASALQTQLKKQGWAIRSHDTTSDSIDFDARRNGVVLRVSVEPNPAAVTIEGYGACVGADGKPSA